MIQAKQSISTNIFPIKQNTCNNNLNGNPQLVSTISRYTPDEFIPTFVKERNTYRISFHKKLPEKTQSIIASNNLINNENEFSLIAEKKKCFNANDLTKQTNLEFDIFTSQTINCNFLLILRL